MTETSSRSERTRIKRNAARAEYDRDILYAILDAARVCHVAYVEAGEPRMIPTAFMRRGDAIYLHGNRQSAMLRALAEGRTACVCVTHTDGLVLARSGFHCSMNYRSAVVFGRGEAVVGDEAHALLDAFVEHLIPGHADAVRRPTAQELAATAVVRIPIEDAAAKVRTGDPIDPEADLGLDTWAGVVPLRAVAGAPEPSADLKAGVPVPDYVLKLGDGS